MAILGREREPIEEKDIRSTQGVLNDVCLDCAENIIEICNCEKCAIRKLKELLLKEKSK